MFGLKMLAGQKIGIKDYRDTIVPVVVNETLIHKLGYYGPGESSRQTYQAWRPVYYFYSGVVHDFQSESKHKSSEGVCTGVQ